MPPRIRTLKPEAPQHRKVGRLKDRAFRLWIVMITQADDEGRLIADAGQLRIQTFGYHQDVTERNVDEALREIAGTGLVVLYDVRGIRYAWFPSWSEHQRIHVRHFTPSKLPPPPAESCPGTVPVPYESGTGTAGSDRIGSDRRQKTTTFSAAAELLPGVVTTNGHGPGTVVTTLTPEEFIQLFNERMPPEIPKVTKLSDARRKAIKAALRQLPDREAWERVLAEVKASPFLLGLRPSPGHEHFLCNLDWLLGKGKTSENYVRVLEGHYRDRHDHADEEGED